MGLNSRYRTWRIVPGAGGDFTAGVSVTACEFTLVGTDPVSETSRADRSFRRFRRQIEITPDIIQISRTEGLIGGTLTRMESFNLIFFGIGGGEGTPVGLTVTSPELPSVGRIIRFLDTDRTATSFRGTGILIDIGWAAGIGAAGQILVFHVPSVVAVFDIVTLLEDNPPGDWPDVIFRNFP